MGQKIRIMDSKPKPQHRALQGLLASPKTRLTQQSYRKLKTATEFGHSKPQYEYSLDDLWNRMGDMFKAQQKDSLDSPNSNKGY